MRWPNRCPGAHGNGGDLLYVKVASRVGLGVAFGAHLHRGRDGYAGELGSDVDGDALTHAYSTPAHGTVRKAGAGIIYTPSAKFVGTDTFRVTVTDTHGATASAIITVTVTNETPVASNTDKRTTVATPVAINLKGTDPDHDPLTYKHQAGPRHDDRKRGGAALHLVCSFAGVDRFRHGLGAVRRKGHPHRHH